MKPHELAAKRHLLPVKTVMRRCALYRIPLCKYTARRQVMSITFPALRYYPSRPSLGHAQNLAARSIFAKQKKK